MFAKASLLATVTLAVLASASPVTLPTKKSTSGIAIPLKKRTSLTTFEGVFDHDAAIAQLITVKNKHRQNLINLEKNKGKAAFKEVCSHRPSLFSADWFCFQGMEIKPLATLPSAVEARMEKRQSESLTDEDQDTEWAGKITIGTPAQSFLIDFDSACILPVSSLPITMTSSF
jgi:cathepsin D